ncbi:DUF6081 family protein [Streptomyces sp. NPDC088196]|uniref:DUF6081 family protein n=1 Tax=Streptomyces sp. NPDC088196 TaxID=3154868 RepID=UPI00344BBD82
MTYTRHSGTGVTTDAQDESVSAAQDELVFVDEFRPATPDREPAGLAVGDGIARVTPEGLVVAPPGRDPATGRPQFTAPTSPDTGDQEPPGLGTGDGNAHVTPEALVVAPPDCDPATDRTRFTTPTSPDVSDREPPGLPPGWLARPAAGMASGDGIARVTPEGLVVAPPGRDPATGRPRFADPVSSDAAGHLRWVAFAGTATPPGFALRDGSVLTARMELSAEIYGPGGHVSGAGVADTRAGMGGMLCVDFGSGLVLDFLLTNDRVWVLYERLGRPGTGHGTFTYEIPVAERSPDRRHRCAVRVDRARGTAVWSLDGEEVLAVPDLGRRLSSRSAHSAHLTRSTDGPEESVRPDQLALGIGLFSEIPESSGVRVTVRRASVSRSAPTR